MMRRPWFFLLSVLLLLLSLQSAAQAEEAPPRFTPKKVATFLAGFASGIAIHELGHVAVASAEGYEARLEGTSIDYSPDFESRSDRLRISTAGFQAQWLAAEAAFYYRDRAPVYTAGMITSHLAVTAAYLTVLHNQPLNDVASAAKGSGLSVEQLLLLAAIPALLDGWRLYGSEVPSWVAPLSIGIKAGYITAIWTY